jgi:adenine deaminase
MASIRPAALLGHHAATGLAPGAPADLLLFREHDRDSFSLEIEQVIKSGRSVIVPVAAAPLRSAL